MNYEAAPGFTNPGSVPVAMKQPNANIFDRIRKLLE